MDAKERGKTYEEQPRQKATTSKKVSAIWQIKLSCMRRA